MAGPDPHEVLGVGPDAPDAEVRTAYRRLVQLHHPDHNGGSAEAARRFEEVQEAYTRIIRLRAGAASGAGGSGQGSAGSAGSAPGAAADADLETRLADIERQVREAHAARERARRAAAEAAAAARDERPTDEQLGYVTTDDSFSRVLADALDDLADRLRRSL